LENESNVSNLFKLLSWIDLIQLQGFARPTYPGVPNILGSRESGPPSVPTSHSSSKPEPSLHPQTNSSQPQNNDFGTSEDPSPEVEDPLAGMNDKDRFGLKGLLAMLKGPYPDQAALVSGIDITTLGFDLNTTE
jgi:hypothetical protein